MIINLTIIKINFKMETFTIITFKSLTNTIFILIFKHPVKKKKKIKNFSIKNLITNANLWIHF